MVIYTTSSRAQTPFERMDRNGDGQLSQQEFRGSVPVFKRMDRNGDRYISRQEAAGTPLSGDRISPKDGMRDQVQHTFEKQPASKPAE